MTGPADDGVPKDDWLRTALRHAPDADAAPPPAVSDAILRAARAQAAAGANVPSAARPSILQGLRDAWEWLARPPVAAGFATVMVATVVTLMWWDRPLEDSLPPREGPPVAQAPAPAAEPAPAAAPAEQAAPAATVAQAPAVQAPAAKAVPRPAPAAPARQEELQRRAEAQRDQVLREREASTTAKAQDVERQARAETDGAIASATAPTGAAARPEAAAPAAAPPVAPTATADASKAVGESAPAVKAESRIAAVAAAPAPAPAPMVQGFAHRDVAAPLGTLRTTIATEPERWSWQRDAGAPATMNTPVMQWLQRVSETARGRWAAPDGPPAVGAAPAATLALLRDGRLHTTLRLGSGAIEIEGTSPRLRAELPAAEATALRVELDQATR